MKKITYQITLTDDAYLEFVSRLDNMILPAKGSLVFKVENVKEEEE